MPDLVTYLAQLIAQDNAVLFVGASLRQGQDQLPLVQQIADALAARIEYRRPDRSLPAVARDFEVMRGRNALILALREELEKLGGQPTPIHQLIADAVLPTTKVITTRFDRVLEQALEQFGKPYVLIVRDSDVPFFDETKVTLIKIQGDITQPDSLVITEDDVDAFISKLPTISDVVRAFFATKTLIFLGYDLNSEQFKRLFRQVTRNLAGFRRRAYAIAAQPVDEVEGRYWETQNVEICPRDPVAFLETLAQAVKAAIQHPPPITHLLLPLAEPPLPPRPYKALDSFTGADVAIFTGRTEESQRLANRILGHRLTVLYGESGSGKTSLLQAGTGPHLAQRRALLAICVPTPEQSLRDLMRQSLADTGRQAGLPSPSEPVLPVLAVRPGCRTACPVARHRDTGDTLPAMIREWQRALDGPIVLAVDQFEQFFLVYDPQERQAAVHFLNELLNDRSLDLRLVLVLREDFLGRLQILEGGIPGLLDVRFRLERLGREAARAAIEEPARLFGVTWEPALVQVLLDDLYASADGGVAPPQLQIVCDCLYQKTVDQGHTQITLALFHQLGGTAAILGDHLDQAVLSFPPERQPTVRALLGALVSSSGVKQRLALDDLARAADVEPADASALLDELTRQRLVRRYEVATERPGEPRLPVYPTDREYELAHDVLVARIARWLGDDFWAAQRVREIVRQALPDWESRGRLLAPGDLRLVAVQRGRVRFSDAELEMIYASAVSCDERPADWQASLSEAVCRHILLRLVQHPEALARERATRRLAAFSGDDVVATLTQAAVADPDVAVRESAACAIAELVGRGDGADGQAAVARLAAAAAEPATAAAALPALVTVRDLQPASHKLLPVNLRGLVRRRVWAARWQRNQHRILTATLRGMQGGFWGLGLGMGLFFGLYNVFNLGIDRLRPQTILGALLLGLSLAGVLGALTVGGGALVGEVLRSLQDRERPLCTWAVTTGVSAVLFGMGLILVGYVSAGAPRPLQTLAAGLLIGLGLAGAATAPLKLAMPMRLTLVALAGMAVFVLAGLLGLFFSRSWGWLLLMGSASGVGFFLGLNPGFERGTHSLPVIITY